MEVPEIADDPRFKTNTDRMTNLKDLEAVLTPVFQSRTQSDWLTRLENAGVPAGPVLNVCEMFGDPHAQARDMIPTVEHATIGSVRTLGLPVKLSETPGKVATGAPVFGQHTKDVLSEYGFAADEIATLADEGAIGVAE